MALATNLGFPRIGAKRELKKAVESFWKGDISEKELQSKAKEIRKNNWLLQQKKGISHIPSNDFSFYDQILDMIATVGAIPSRYNFSGDRIDLQTYFAMARGNQRNGQDVTAMEMTKWFDTNYHYIVPEFEANQSFKLTSSKIIDEFKEAKELGINTRSVIIGPITFLKIGKVKNDEVSNVSLLENILPVYKEILSNLENAGAKFIQIDEPALTLNLNEEEKKAFTKAYRELSEHSNLKILVTTYFGDLRDNLELAANLPVEALHVDLVRGEKQLDEVLNAIGKNKTLSVGIVDGRNIWKNDLEKSINIVNKAISALGNERVFVAPSCSLLHSPVDLADETKLDEEIKNWLSFATQKLDEIALITKATNDGEQAIKEELIANKDSVSSRKTSTRIHNQDVKDRVSNITPNLAKRNLSFDKRISIQKDSLGLPVLPTTTIGSFPQTNEIRKARAQFKKGELSRAEYDNFLEEKTKEVVHVQEEIGIDVLVHGEYERNDMVEYFGEKLEGFAFTQNGWVQSYGSRCVKPPVIFGDIYRNDAMTVRWTKFAQGQTQKLMKGMLTGPVTILQWSFVRDDQPRKTTCQQIALAILDEVKDLEANGIKVIQIDEPAFREGLPLREEDYKEYLDWAAESFRLSSSDIKNSTQIHTHMCYSEFNDIIQSIADLDADVISIETSRSAMELLDAFIQFKYPNEIGPGVYDIHSPRIPKVEEMEFLLNKALNVLSAEQIWVNPDCGLKTRGWEEVKPALENMVVATKNIREKLEKDRATA